MSISRCWLIVLTIACCSPLYGQLTDQQKYVISVDRIWAQAGHSAFTDLIHFDGALYCTFREGSDHIPGTGTAGEALNGVIRVLRSGDGGANWRSFAMLEEAGVDLRDPKLSITPDGRLMVNMGASTYHGRKRLGIASRVAFLKAGEHEFGELQTVVLPQHILTGFDWLWRVTWHDGWGWGTVQQVPDGGPRALHLVRSRDGVTYEHVTQLAVDLPTETTLRFLGDGTMLAMIRTTAKPAVGLIGTSKPPYNQWTYATSNKAFGGPNLVQLPNGAWLAGSRGYDKQPYTTQLWWFDPAAARFDDLLTLPSGGDNSYPGFVADEQAGQLLVSYYSAHEGKAAIYLARLRLGALMEGRRAE